MAEWTLPLPVRQFSKWLVDQESARSVVGIGRSGDHCPLASWLADRMAGQYVSIDVAPDAITIEYGEGEYAHRDTPPWAARFIEGIDEMHPRRGVVRAGEAWRVLDRAWRGSHVGMFHPTKWKGFRA